MFSISPFSDDYPSLFEALQAKKEVDIIEKQSQSLVFSRPVRHVLFEINSRHKHESSKEIFVTIDAFYYGYILGKRAERARRNHKQA